MNSVELKNTLVKMAFGHEKQSYCNGIIDTILAHYMTYAEYYEEDAIATFNGFLNTGILSW